MTLKKTYVKKRSPVKTAFATSLIVSLAFFATLFALNMNLISDFFGSNPSFRWMSQNTSQRNPSDPEHPSPSESFEDYLEDTVFIGDSRTVGFAHYGYLKDKNVYAIKDQTQQGALSDEFVDMGTGRLLTVAQAAAISKPKRMIVAFGINEMYVDEVTFINHYSKLVDDLRDASPNSQIIIQSMLPVSYSYPITKNANISNDKIDSYNELLKQFAKDKNCKYLDTTSALKDKYNSLAPEYDGGDGLHFNANAYKALLQYLEQHRIY